MPSPILILGATGGIGSAIALKLASVGAEVILHGRDRARLESLSKEIGRTASTCVADLTSEVEVKSLFLDLASRYESLSGVIFTIATPFQNKLAHRTGWDAFEAQMNTQLKALHLCATAAMPLMSNRESTARLIVVGTEFTTFTPPKKTACYVSAKAAMSAYAQVIAQEWLTSNIRVHIVAPGLVKTNFVAAMPDEFLEQVAEQMPERRLTSVEDVARMVAFMMTDAADPLYGIPVRVSRDYRK
jgi:NAD(P)-dependent dehydrogenase (short-subunit alcohol dehydrogenase family)